MNARRPPPGKSIRALAVGLTLVHAAFMGVYAVLKMSPAALANGALAMICLVLSFTLTPLATHLPARAHGVVVGLGVMELGLFSWRLRAGDQVWFVGGLTSMLGVWALYKSVRRLSSALETGTDPDASQLEPGSGRSVPAPWPRIPPRVRGIVMILLGVCLLLGTTRLLTTLRFPVEGGDPFALTWAPGLFLSFFGIIQLVLGRPFSDWDRAWNALSVGVQRLIVYGLLFGGPILVVWILAKVS